MNPVPNQQAGAVQSGKPKAESREHFHCDECERVLDVRRKTISRGPVGGSRFVMEASPNGFYLRLDFEDLSLCADCAARLVIDPLLCFLVPARPVIAAELDAMQRVIRAQGTLIAYFNRATLTNAIAVEGDCLEAIDGVQKAVDALDQLRSTGASSLVRESESREEEAREVSIVIESDRVVVQMPRLLRWFAVTAPQAREIGEALLRSATELETAPLITRPDPPTTHH